MTEDNTERSAQPSRRRPLRTRGGLGRGLGALIPDSEPTNLDTPGRPLDVFFPDLTGSTRQGEGDSGRGGSAKDLLSPLPRAKDVSRETSTSPSAEGPLVSSELRLQSRRIKDLSLPPIVTLRLRMFHVKHPKKRALILFSLSPGHPLGLFPQRGSFLISSNPDRSLMTLTFVSLLSRSLK